MPTKYGKRYGKGYPKANNPSYAQGRMGKTRPKKAEMERRALTPSVQPGGFGTLEELSETLTQRQLHIHGKPVVLLNTAGFFRSPCWNCLRTSTAPAFAREEQRLSYAVAQTPAAALDLTEADTAPLPPKWRDGR